MLSTYPTNRAASRLKMKYLPQKTFKKSRRVQMQTLISKKDVKMHQQFHRFRVQDDIGCRVYYLGLRQMTSSIQCRVILRLSD